MQGLSPRTKSISDTDKDGRISFFEAFAYALSKHSFSGKDGQKPVIVSDKDTHDITLTIRQ